MTKGQTLTERVDLLKTLACSVQDDILIVRYNRRLDMNLTFLKHISKRRFTEFMEEIQELYIKYHKSDV